MINRTQSGSFYFSNKIDRPFAGLVNEMTKGNK